MAPAGSGGPHVPPQSQEEAVLEEMEVVTRRRNSLRQIPLFASQPEEVVALLAVYSRALRFAPGEAVVRQGEEGSEMFVIVTGEVAVLVQTAAGREVELRHLQAGQFFGELSLLIGARRSATVRAVQECELLSLAKTGFALVLEKHPEFADSVRQSLETWQADQVQALEQELADGLGTAGLVGQFEANFKLGW